MGVDMGLHTLWVIAEMGLLGTSVPHARDEPGRPDPLIAGAGHGVRQFDTFRDPICLQLCLCCSHEGRNSKKKAKHLCGKKAEGACCSSVERVVGLVRESRRIPFRC